MNIMKNLLSMQSKLNRIKEEAAKSEFTEELEGVKVLIAGDRTIKRIDVSKIYENQEELLDLITVAINKAGYKAEEEIKRATKEALGPMGKFMPL